MDAPLPKTVFEFTEVIDAIDQGMLWLDAELRVLGHNRAYRDMLALEHNNAFVGRPYRDLLAYLLDRGEFFEAECDSYLDARINAMERRETLRIERMRPNGMALAIKAAPLASGGYVLTCMDVTRERAAREAHRRNTKATVVAMANFAEHRDADTGVHVLRVARLVGQTARKLQAHDKFAAVIDDNFIEHIATASILHDVGKIATPDGILLKPGPLDAAERLIMNQHPAVGADLLKQAKQTMGQSPYLDFGIEAALTHHEWYNGGGYPQGLAGAAIPLSGRICAVVDVFDALTSRRPYKAPWDTAKAVALIRAQRGTQFDPDVVDVFLAVIDERETVSLVRWTEAFSVGNIHIDEQHCILIDTINQLASAASLNNRHCVSMIIDELVSYAAFHFDYEEKLMARAGYPELAEHRIVHQAFVKWVSDLRDGYLSYGKRSLGDSVLNYLRDWLSHHILGEDQRYRPFILALA